MDWTSMSTNIHVEILLLKMMVLGGGAIRCWLGHEGETFMNGIGDLIKEAPEIFLSSSTM